MPQLIALGLIGLAGYIAWNALKRQMQAIGEEARKREKASEKHGSNTTQSVGQLERGEDGVYRPRRAEDGVEEKRDD